MVKDEALIGTRASDWFDSYTEVGFHFNRWAEEKEGSYEEACVRNNYFAPKFLADKVLKLLPDISLKVIDFACGTGISGEPFIQCGDIVDGIDLSLHMAKKAKLKGYRQVFLRDLNRMDAAFLNTLDRYDVAICVGCFGEYVNPKKVIPIIIDSLNPHATIGLTSEVKSTNIDELVMQLESHRFREVSVETKPAYEAKGEGFVYYHFITAKRE